MQSLKKIHAWAQMKVALSKESHNLDMALIIHVAFSADPDEMLHYAV